MIKEAEPTILKLQHGIHDVRKEKQFFESLKQQSKYDFDNEKQPSFLNGLVLIIKVFMSLIKLISNNKTTLLHVK